MTKNHIQEVPLDLPYLYRIKVLKAASNDLTAIPTDIVKMTSLETLDLKDNMLETVPEAICKLPALLHLDLSDNKLKAFPNKLEQLKQRCTIATEGQSSYKQRDPPDILKAGEAQTNKEKEPEQ